MKVGTFQRVAGQKQGGNVASYFCTPEGKVLHFVAGPVSADVLLREARWVIDTRKLARLKPNDGRRFRDVFRRAHLERLRQEAPGQTPPAHPIVNSVDVADVLHTPGLSTQGRIHRLLSAAALVPIEKVYRAVFEELLNEPVSTAPVVETAGAGSSVQPASEGEEVRRARRSPSLAEIHSGQALNVLLLDLQQLAERGVTVPRLPISEEVRDHLQPAAGGQEGVPSWLTRKTLPWPALLRLRQLEETRHDLEERIGRLTHPEPGHLPDPDEVCKLVAYIQDVERWIALRLRTNPDYSAWDWRESMTAWRFLTQLRKSVQALGDAEALRYLDGSYSIQGKTVAELVQHMAAHGLRFAPAAPGDEAAYLALHQLLSSAALGARASLE